MSVTYGTYNLTVTSPVQTITEIFTLAEIREALRLPSISYTAAADAELNGMISAAREVAEYYQHKDLVRKQWDLSLDAFPASEIQLRAALASVDLVKYRNSSGAWTSLVENTNYIYDTSKQPGVLMPAYGESWPSFTAWPSGAVLIRFTSGLATTDGFWTEDGWHVKVGMKHLISAWWNNELPFEMGANAVQEYPFTVTALLSMGARPICA